MIVKCKGILRHMFHGEYGAAIGLQFSNADEANLALKTLGPDWKLGKEEPRACIWVGGSDKLDGVKERFKEWGLKTVPCGRKHCSHQCKEASIDSLNHSIDYGPWFELEIPVQDPNQVLLFGNEV